MESADVSLSGKDKERILELLRECVTSPKAGSDRKADGPPDTSASPALGDSAQIEIPGYQIDQEIARGGQAIVFKGVQRSSGLVVALKVLCDGRHLIEEQRSRFDREIHILSGLKHPHIVSVIDSGQTSNGCPFFATTYIEGRSLDQWMQVDHSDHPTSDPFGNPGRTLTMFLKILDAVGAAHRCGITHRDLKPSNIQIDRQDNPHILDFGLARPGIPLRSDPDGDVVTLTGQFLGSLPYASPEQAEGLTSRIDIRTDVYSLGVILYQMLTGGFPYDVVGTLRDVLDNIMRAEPIPPSTVIAARIARQAKRQKRSRKRLQNPIARDLEAIILKALSKRPEDRYQSASEMASDIERYMAGQPVMVLEHRSSGLIRVTKRLGLIGIGIICVLVMFSTTHVFRSSGKAGTTSSLGQIGVLPPSAHLGEVVEFADPGLKMAVERQLGVKDPTRADMLNIRQLTARSWEIKNLAGLEHATNMDSTLHLRHNEIDDLQPIASLTKLDQVVLGDNKITDIAPLAQLKQMRALSIGNNLVSDISCLKGHPALEQLDLGKGQIRDISVLVTLPKLVHLHIVDNPIEDYSVLADLKNIEFLRIRRTSFSDTQLLRDMARLKSLDLSTTEVSDISVLAHLPQLEELTLMNTKVTDISPLTQLTKLEVLNLRGNSFDNEAYTVHIPQIRANNPGVKLLIDARRPQ